MKIKKVNCIIMCCEYAEEAYPTNFIFNTSFYGVKNYTPREAVLSLARDWLEVYKEMYKDPKKKDLQEFIMDAHTMSDGSHGFWPSEHMKHQCSWSPWWLDKSLQFIHAYEYLVIKENAETIIAEIVKNSSAIDHYLPSIVIDTTTLSWI